jgi:hypothetical protein
MRSPGIFGKRPHRLSRRVGQWACVFAGAALVVLVLSQVDRPPVEVPEVHLQSALLCDYYEHGLEHAPPRDPSGSMQRRELFYRTPPDPVDALCRGLGTGSTDRRTKDLFLRWQSKWLSGDSSCASVACARELSQAAEGSSIDAVTLLEMGRALNWLVDDQFSAEFYKAALRRGFRDGQGLRPGDPQCLPFLRGLDQTRAFWRIGDYEGLELRFRYARRFNLPLSVESRRAACLLVDALYDQHRIDEALDTLAQAQAEDDRVGDLGALDRSDLNEMDYLHGFLLQCAGRNALAIPYLLKVKRGRDHAEDATRSLFLAYVGLERFDDAKATLDEFFRKFIVSPAQREAFQTALEQARQSAAGRNAIAQLFKD